MTASELIIGQEYHVRHTRKGQFAMRVDSVDGEWVSGVISSGKATALLSYNKKETGEEITIRDCHSYFTHIPS
jgi:hypothetical protein